MPNHLVTVQHQEELNRVIESHQNARPYTALKLLIQNAITNKLTIHELHVAISELMEKSRSEHSFMERRVYKTRSRHDHLMADLQICMDSQVLKSKQSVEIEIEKERSRRLTSSRRKNIQTGFEKTTPLPLENFIKDLICIHTVHVEEEIENLYSTSKNSSLKSQTVNTFIAWIIEDYGIIYGKYQNTEDEVWKSYYCLRLERLKYWLDLNAYRTFIKRLNVIHHALINFQSEHIPYDDADILNFLTSCYARIASSEVPCAMLSCREILESIAKPEEIAKNKFEFNKLIQMIHCLELFFVLKFSVDTVNIDPHFCDPIKEQLDRIVQHENSHNTTELINAIQNIRITIEKLYHELRVLIPNQGSINTTLTERFDKCTLEDEQKYQKILDSIDIADSNFLISPGHAQVYDRDHR